MTRPMEIRYAVGFREFTRMTTEELRRNFLVENLFTPGEIELVYWETDRTVVGGAMPLLEPLPLPTHPPLAAEYFCQRRELGVMNIGGPGLVTVDDASFAADFGSCLYVGVGNRNVAFASRDAVDPARFYLVSYPASTPHPTTLVPMDAANRVELGSSATANRRTIYQYIHEQGARSAQLVMGFTRLEEGSVWNTMPPHTHTRRSEVYCYFGLPAQQAVVHLLGPGDETRHLFVRQGEVALSPVWSVHSGCGTQAYSFIWAMGGENQRFADMDQITVDELR